MHLSKHALYRGQIYARPNTAQFTYISLMDVSSYLNKLLANDAINKHLVKHLKTVETILSHPACEIIQQIHFDFNLIEVSNGFCFAISSRAFLPNAIRESNIGKLSPRAYIPYDCSSPPEPRYFREGVYNSFPDEEVRLKFLNKFYQCLLAHKMPQKTRKLVVSGPRDSGKTSWAYVFHRIIPPQYIASVTNERQFSASMINDDTQLVMIDEWSASTMSSDLAKTILQGGWMITAVKHAAPRHVNCHSPFYITTNTVPDFHEENENVERRIEIFTTSSLSTITPGIDQWIYNNAMDCIAWIAEEINTHRSLIPSEERWYEDEDTLNSVVPSLDIVAQWERGNIVEIREADLDPQQTTYAKTPLIDENIHSGFITEAKTRRVAKKRRRRRQIYSNDSSCEEDDPSNFSTFLDREKNICSQTSQTQAIPPANNEPQMYNEMNEDSQTFDERPLLCQGEIIPPANIEPTCTDLAQTIPPANVQPTSTELAQSPVEVHVPPADNHPSQTQAIPPANNEPQMYNEMNEDSQTFDERPLLCQGEIIPPANIEPTCTDLAQTIPPANVQPTSTELAQSPVEVHVPPADNHPSQTQAIPPANNEPQMYNEMNEDSQTFDERPLLCQGEIIPPANIEPTCTDLAQTIPPANVQPTSTELAQSPVEVHVPPADNHPSQTQAIPPANNEPRMYNEMNEDSQTSEEWPLLCQDEIIPPANIEPTCIDLAQTTPPTNVQPTSTELVQYPVEVHVPPADNHPSTSTGITQAPVSDETNDTPDVWKLNDKVYMGRVADLITFNFYKDLQRGHVHSFTERVRQAKMRRDVKEQHFWVKADPEIDAWMLATNRKRDMFDIDAFVEYQPDILPHLKRLRQTLNVLVLTSRCLVTNALNKKMNHDADQETNDGPQLSSQSYWTTFKTWWR